MEVLIQAILNVPEEDVPTLVRQIRTCESLDTVAEALLAREAGIEEEDEDLEADLSGGPTFETQLSGKMGELRLEDGSTRYIGGTSNLLFLGNGGAHESSMIPAEATELYPQQTDAVLSWTEVSDDSELVMQ